MLQLLENPDPQDDSQSQVEVPIPNMVTSVDVVPPILQHQVGGLCYFSNSPDVVDFT
jgi:hypothetical protein